MKLTIFSATGGIGRQVLEQAVAAGHDVTAVVQNPRKLSGQVRIVTADLAAAGPAALESAVEGADAVLSGLGPRSNFEAGIASQGTVGRRSGDVRNGRTAHHRRQCLPDRHRAFARPPEAAETPPGRRVLHAKPVQSVDESRPPQALRRPRADGGHPSGQRPGLDRRTAATADRQATDRHLPDGYGQNLRRGMYISRADVGHHMLRVLEQPETAKQTIGIAN